MSDTATPAATKTVVFTREHAGGLLASKIWVEGDLLYFQNDEASKALPAGATCIIEWEIVGPTSSGLLVTKRDAADAGGEAKEIVNSTIRSQDHAHREDSKLFVA